MVTGEEHETIDHRNLDRAGNHWENLRPSSYGQNNANSAVRADSRSGLKGVYQSGQRFKARIKSGGRATYLGSFSSAKEAHAAYCRAAQELHGEFWNPG